MTLSQHHLEMLTASGITPEFAELRGYQTITDRSRLAGLPIHTGETVAIVTPGRRVPGLLIPLLSIDGEIRSYQYRPDNPRLDADDGRPIKYESMWKQPPVLDVAPGLGQRVVDPNEDLWITEGSRKADAAAVAGLCCASVSGVWNWMMKTSAGASMALPEFRDIPWKGPRGRRRVVIAYDSDAVRNPKVHKAMHALSQYLSYRGARIEYVWLPDTDSTKVGLDDYLACHTVDELMTLVKPTKPPPRADQPEPAPPQPEPKPPPPPYGSINGAALLDDVDTFLGRYVIYPDEHTRHTHTLWAAHTHLMDCWESTPRITFLSPEPSSGKTRALEVTEPLVPRPIHAVNVTSAYLFRKVSDPAGLPTVLYDEVDTVFGPKSKECEDIRGLINAGHRFGAVAGRCATRGDNIITEELPAYCAVAMAGLDDLPDTIMTRAVVVRMKKRAPGENVQPWRQRTGGAEGRELGQRLAQWADTCREQVKQGWPQMPDGVDDRNADKWEALLAVADLAGGHWPATARVAAVADVADSMRDTGSIGVLLLRDMKALFDKLPDTETETLFHKPDKGHLMSACVTKDLKEIEESPWATISRDGGPITARGLARRLGKYGIHSTDIRGSDGKNQKGYYRADFLDAWNRYLPRSGSESCRGSLIPRVAALFPATAGVAPFESRATVAMTVLLLGAALIGWGFPASCVPVDKLVDRGTDDDVEQAEADDQSCRGRQPHARRHRRDYEQHNRGHHHQHCDADRHPHTGGNASKIPDSQRDRNHPRRLNPAWRNSRHAP
jgi:hypothetical protein